MIISARLPMLMFSSALAVSPRSWHSLSVANVRVIDKGTMVIKLQMNMTRAGASLTAMIIASKDTPKEKVILKSRSTLPCRRNAKASCSQISYLNGA